MADASSPGSGGGRVGYTVGLTASIPLYDGGQRDADAEASKARLDRATLNAQSIRQTVDQEAASAWLNLQAATQQVQTAQVGVNAAQQAYDLANLRYNAGKSVTAERLDALAALTRARGDLSAATATAIETRAHLLTAIGSTL
jgi:outer membrane protein TolC